jgi:hypothetical protein
MFNGIKFGCTKGVMAETPWGAVCPGTFLSVLMIGVKCSPFQVIYHVQPLIGAAAVRSASLPYGVAVVDRSRPQVSDQGEANAPGDGKDGTVTDRGPQQQPPQRVDDGREGLVLGKPAHPG